MPSCRHFAIVVLRSFELAIVNPIKRNPEMRVQALICAGAIAGVSLLAGPVLSQDTPRPQPPRPGQQPPSQPPSQPPPGQQPGQQPGMRQGSGPQQLMPLIGTWEVTVKTFAAGGSAQPSPSSQMTGTSTRTWLFPNKVMQEDVRCNTARLSSTKESDQDLGYAPPTDSPPGRSAPPRPDTPGSRDPMAQQGQPFQGHCLFGYDMQDNKFQCVWADNTHRELSMSQGTYDPSAKTF